MTRHDYLTKVREALQAMEVARSRFDYATGPYVDSAVLELTAADMRLSAALTEVRPLFCPLELDKMPCRGKECQG